MTNGETTTIDQGLQKPAPMGLKPVRRTSLSSEIVDQIIDLISRNELNPGEQLPSERELCKIFGVGRTSIREAIRSLTTMGVLDGRVGRGTFVCDNSEYLERTLKWGMLLDQNAIRDLAETRLVLECETARLAATRAQASELNAVEIAYREMERNAGDTDQFLQADLQFHLLIGQATHNSILNRLLGMTRTSLQEWIGAALRKPSPEETRKRVSLTLRQHGEILEALKERSAHCAAEAMREHIVSSIADVQAHLEEPH